MDAAKIKRMLDACYLAKRIRELLPDLPDGVAPAYIQYMDVMHELQSGGASVRVSDISDALNLSRPVVTRTVKHMEEKGYIRKFTSGDDCRVTYLAITEQGEALSEKYDRSYYSRLAPLLDGISDAEADCMISVIERFYTVMKERSVDIE